jgi:hypothetical protein
VRHDGTDICPPAARIHAEVNGSDAASVAHQRTTANENSRRAIALRAVRSQACSSRRVINVSETEVTAAPLILRDKLSYAPPGRTEWGPTVPRPETLSPIETMIYSHRIGPARAQGNPSLARSLCPRRVDDGTGTDTNELQSRPTPQRSLGKTFGHAVARNC